MLTYDSVRWDDKGTLCRGWLGVWQRGAKSDARMGYTYGTQGLQLGLTF